MQALSVLGQNMYWYEVGNVTAEDAAIILNDAVESFTFDVFTVGVILPFAGDVLAIPVGTLVCDGMSYLRTDYPLLYAIIGTTYGSDDSDHFNVPNLIGRVVSGAGSTGGLSTHALGEAYGSETITLGIGDVPSHTHSDAGHSHSEGTSTPSVGAAITGVPVPSAVPSLGITGVGNANLSSVGGGGAHDNQQPTIALNYIIVAE